MPTKRPLADRFLATAAWGRGKQLSVALVVDEVAVAVGAIFDRLAGSTPDSLPLLTLPNSIVTIAQSPPSVNPTASPATQSAPVTAPTIGTINPPTSGTVAVAPPVAADGTMNALDVLAAIPVELEHRGGYDRDLFAVWSDLDGDGCDTREEVLIEESLSQAQVDPSGCAVVAGDWSPIGSPSRPVGHSQWIPASGVVFEVCCRTNAPTPASPAGTLQLRDERHSDSPRPALSVRFCTL